MIVVYRYVVEGVVSVPNVPGKEMLEIANDWNDDMRAKIEAVSPSHQVCSDIRVSGYKDNDKLLEEIIEELEELKSQDLIQHLVKRKKS